MRFAALLCVEKVAESLGDEYLTILTDTVPFLSELMEGNLRHFLIYLSRLFSTLRIIFIDLLQTRARQWNQNVGRLLLFSRHCLASHSKVNFNLIKELNQTIYKTCILIIEMFNFYDYVISCLSFSSCEWTTCLDDITYIFRKVSKNGSIIIVCPDRCVGLALEIWAS